MRRLLRLGLLRLLGLLKLLRLLGLHYLLRLRCLRLLRAACQVGLLRSWRLVLHGPGGHHAWLGVWLLLGLLGWHGPLWLRYLLGLLMLDLLRRLLRWGAGLKGMIGLVRDTAWSNLELRRLLSLQLFLTLVEPAQNLLALRKRRMRFL